VNLFYTSSVSLPHAFGRKILETRLDVQKKMYIFWNKSPNLLNKALSGPANNVMLIIRQMNAKICIALMKTWNMMLRGGLGHSSQTVGLEAEVRREGMDMQMLIMAHLNFSFSQGCS
jgi:hypothetical protein